MEKTDPLRPVTVDEVIAELTRLLPTGIRPTALLKCHRLVSLCDLTARPGASDEYIQVFALEALIRDAIDALGNGPYGQAAAALFGTTARTRGLTLRDRRRLAAEALNDMLPSTFRRNYEHQLVEDVAVELWRLRAVQW